MNGFTYGLLLMILINSCNIETKLDEIIKNKCEVTKETK